jgi:zinc protease
MAVVNLRSLTQSDLLEPALDLFAQLVSSPQFPKEALERERARTLVALRQADEDPASVVSKAFLKLMYGDHPYSRDPLGSVAGLRAITPADLREHHKRFYVGRNASLAIVGDVSLGDAKQFAKKVVGGLAPGDKPPPLPAAPQIREPRRELISFPASQSHLRIGQPGVTRDDPDYYPLYVGNYILGGGGLVSRLSDEIREKRGLSYSVYSYFTPMRIRGPFTIGLQTKNSQRDESLKIVQTVVADFIANGPTPEELAAAKKHLTGGFPLRIDSNAKISENLAVIGFYELPLTYLNEFIPRVEAVTLDQVRDAFRRHIDLEKMVTVIVGGMD